MDNLGYLFAAYTIIWALIAGVGGFERRPPEPHVACRKGGGRLSPFCLQEYHLFNFAGKQHNLIFRQYCRMTQAYADSLCA
jgi:hypothetical protein